MNLTLDELLCTLWEWSAKLIDIETGKADILKLGYVKIVPSGDDSYLMITFRTDNLDRYNNFSPSLVNRITDRPMTKVELLAYMFEYNVSDFIFKPSNADIVIRERE